MRRHHQGDRKDIMYITAKKTASLSVATACIRYMAKELNVGYYRSIIVLSFSGHQHHGHIIYQCNAFLEILCLRKFTFAR